MSMPDRQVSRAASGCVDAMVALSDRDVEELLTERGIDVDHVTELAGVI
jgi:transposase-like protein